MKNTHYYHISPTENLASILKNGLKSKTKQIFVSSTLEQLPLIASGQIFLHEYSIFKLNSEGIKVTPIHDNVGEIGNQFQFIIEQALIEPKYIEHLKDERWNFWDLQEHCSRVKNSVIGLEKMGKDKMLQLQVSISKDWCNHFNKKYGTNVIPIKHDKQ